MSRNSTTRPIGGDHGAALDVADNSHQIVQDIIALHGDQAPTAAAWCAFTAWCEGDDEEYRFWSRIFLRLRN
ncbi:hypothetical protein HGP16_32170 [Rhizobium sp. P40RR-XXII]|uniref:hypothetical protein n=1 Tax=unclassified Rhizobium TaxID=2613769 RepID=UPI00145677F8|nr:MULTISPECIES: hypothetical protein [unclassified Rhizobium]NLR89294.1 hypothetical protein [Rhizobium sp. P28RR-XV]NLS21156.1 hypothetical protein [Rhizobium sp. P40RR-XXII]